MVDLLGGEMALDSEPGRGMELTRFRGHIIPLGREESTDAKVEARVSG
jgi:hypothetical protein